MWLLKWIVEALCEDYLSGVYNGYKWTSVDSTNRINHVTHDATDCAWR